MTLAIIAAVATNGVIGRGNRLPWHLPADMKRFKELTTGHTIIMGRRTYDSIGRPLPRRRSVVVTRNPDFQANGVEVAHSLEEAVKLVRHEPRSFVIGGAEIFAAALPHARELYLTRVHAEIDGDVFLPEFNEDEWELVEDHYREADDKNAYPISFQVYRRR